MTRRSWGLETSFICRSLARSEVHDQPDLLPLDGAHHLATTTLDNGQIGWRKTKKIAIPQCSTTGNFFLTWKMHLHGFAGFWGAGKYFTLEFKSSIWRKIFIGFVLFPIRGGWNDLGSVVYTVLQLLETRTYCGQIRLIKFSNSLSFGYFWKSSNSFFLSSIRWFLLKG